MKDLIFEVNDYFGEFYMKKYQVDMGNLKDRIRGVRDKAWSPWRDLTTVISNIRSSGLLSIGDPLADDLEKSSEILQFVNDKIRQL